MEKLVSGTSLLSLIKGDPSGKPIQFITVDEKSGHFEVTQQAMMFLESLPRNQKVAVVAIAGPYRTGKSFLANRLLGQSQGFEIGSTTQACTKGIWMWNRAVQVKEDVQMLVLDTEGLQSSERSTNVDIRMFALTLLLSSLFVYNQMGPVSEHALDDLSLVAQLSNHLQISKYQKVDDQTVDCRQYFPSFFWVMRDFFHDLEGRSPKEYLEDCLKEAPGYTADVVKKNRVRAAITRTFKEREAFTMIRPVADEAKLAHIENVKWDATGDAALKPEFKKQVNAFIN
jgi:hypothetical protein